MKLKLLERFVILKMLPIEGTFATLNIVRTLQKSLAPSEEEYKEFGIKQAGEEYIDKDGNKIIVPENQSMWNEKGVEEIDIEIGEKATDIIIESLEKLDKEGKLMSQHMSIYEKFIKNKG